MTEVSIGLAFAAGLLSFVSPCVLALLPVYLAFLGDAAVAEDSVRTNGVAASRVTAVASRTAVLGQALLFVGGFSAVFVVLGTSIGVLGGPLFRVAEIRQLAGLIVIALGLLTTGLFGPVLDRLSVGLDPASLPAARSARSLALGAFVAVGWTPCIGPVLGAIFTMGASSGSAPAVAILLAAYSAGLAIPFLAAAVALPAMRPAIDALRRHHRAVRIVAGGLIVVIGVMIFFNAFARLATLFTFVL
jgi:cytochrome c-type biogenesis protein